MIEIRGITVNMPGPSQTIKLLARGPRPDQYVTLDFPNTLPLNEGQIRKLIGNHFGIPPGQVVWPEHIKIPGE